MSYLYKIGPKYFKIIDFYILSRSSLSLNFLQDICFYFMFKKDETLYQKHYNTHFIVQPKIDQLVFNINYKMFRLCPEALMVVK